MKDVIITPKLSRAARALIDWQQSDLAGYANISLSAVKSFEMGAGKTRASTQSAIQNALEGNGIEFLQTGGLRAIDEIASVSRYTGQNYMSKWYDDIYLSCASDDSSPSEILASSVDQNLWASPALIKSSDQFESWMKKSKTTMRSLIPKGQRTINQPTALYRSVPTEMLGKVTYCIYADRLAFVLWKKQQILVIRNISIVETFRSQFNYLWKLGQIVSN